MATFGCNIWHPRWDNMPHGCLLNFYCTQINSKSWRDNAIIKYVELNIDKKTRACVEHTHWSAVDLY